MAFYSSTKIGWHDVKKITHVRITTADGKFFDLRNGFKNNLRETLYLLFLGILRQFTGIIQIAIVLLGLGVVFQEKVFDTINFSHYNLAERQTKVQT